MSSKKKSGKGKSLSTPKEESNDVLMTVQPTKKRKKIIKIETENTKKEKEEILKQNELKIQIKEIEEKINFEQNQHNILMSIKKEELFRKEKNIEQIEESNKNLQLEIDRLQNEIDTKLQKKEVKEKDKEKDKDKKEESNNDDKNDMNNNKSEENINPIVKELKENEKEIENSRQIIDKYQKEVNNLQKTVNKKIDMTQLNSIKEEIKSTKERINLMEKEKKYLLVISQEHNKCIEYQNKLQDDINHFQNELNLLKIENKEKVKIRIEKYKNDTKSNNNIYKGLSPEQIRQKKEQHIKNTLDEFWAANKEKLLKCSLSDNNLSNFNNDESPNDISKINKNHQSSKLLFKKKKRYGEGIKNYNLDININNELPVLPLFNNNEKKILLNVLPEEEIKKYEKRYECADAEKKNLQRLFAFETRQLLKENKDIKNKYELNNIQLKENEHKNNLLTAQIEGQTKEYEKLKNKMNNMIKEIEEKTKKLKQWEEENHTMALKLKEIKEKYEEIVKEEVDEEEELEEEEEEGDGDGDEETNK